MKDKKLVLISFAFYDRDNLAKYLEEQAAAGWLIESYSLNHIRFRQIRPEKLRFSIIYYHTPVTANCLTNEQMEYLEFCARTGWYLVAAERRMLIMANQAEHPIPIETDPEIQLENIHKSVKKQHIRNMILYIAMGVLYFIWSAYMGVVYLFASATPPTHFLMMGAWYCALGLPDMIGYYIWRRKARATAAEGTFYSGVPSNCLFYIAMLLVFALCAALLVIHSYGINPVLNGIIITIITIGIICGVYCLLGRQLSKISAGVCRNIVTMGLTAFLSLSILIPVGFSPVYYFNHGQGSVLANPPDIPISVTELTGASFDDYITRKYTGGSLLLSQDEYLQDTVTGCPDFRYTITYVHADFLYDACQKDLLKDFARRGEAITADASGWNADAAYQLYKHGSAQHNYLLCYDGYFVEILFGWAPTPEQIAIVAQKLSDI